jgi:hypothetical protein
MNILSLILYHFSQFSYTSLHFLLPSFQWPPNANHLSSRLTSLSLYTTITPNAILFFFISMHSKLSTLQRILKCTNAQTKWSKNIV